MSYRKKMEYKPDNVVETTTRSTDKEASLQRAVWRKGGSSPAENFVRN